MKWRVVLKPDLETKDWAVWCPQLPGCASAGENEGHALPIIETGFTIATTESAAVRVRKARKLGGLVRSGGGQAPLGEVGRFLEKEKYKGGDI